MSNDPSTRAELIEEIEKLRETVQVLELQGQQLHEARQALRRSEADHQRLLNDLPSEFFFYRHDSRGVFTFVSPSVTKMLGYDRVEFLEHYSKYMTDSEINRRAVEMTDLGLSGVKPPPYQVEILHRDGSVKLLEVVESPVLDEEGRVTAVEGVARDVTGRRLAEAALRASEERFRAAFDQAPVGMMLITNEGILTDANDAMCGILGYGPGELDGTDCLALTHPGDRSATRVEVENLRRQHGKNYRMRKRYMRRDGSPVMCEVIVHALRDSADGPAGFIVHATDLTEMESAQEEISRAQRDWEAIFRAVGHPMMILAPDRTILAANEASAALVGGSAVDAVGRKCFEILHGGTIPCACPFPEMLASGRIQSSEMLLEFSGRTYLVSCTPVTRPDGRLEKIIHMATDITDRKRAEKALAASEEKFRTFFENETELCFMLDPDGAVTDLNRAAEAALGSTRAEAAGRALGSLFDSTSGRKLDEMVRVLLADPEPGSLELELTTMVGRRLSVLLNVGVIGTDRNLQGQCIVTMRDVTESRLLQQELAHSQKMESVGRLAGGVAHDFNNVLTVIFGRCDLLLSRLQANDPLALDVMQIRECAARSADITQQLLAFSRKQVTSPENLDLDSVVERMRKMLTHLIGEDVELAVRFEQGLPAVRADRTQIEQVVMNLVLNARDAMPCGGTLTLRTERTRLPDGAPALAQRLPEGEYAVLHVTDTGTGMGREVMDRLFEPFFTTKEPGRGGGLGLSTVYGIVSQSGGAILVESEPGEGSTFSVYLPASTASLQEPPQLPVRTGSLSGTETVLLIEDEASVRVMLAQMLREQGYEVIDSHSGEEALNLFHALEKPPDLILSDVVLPGISGPDTVDRIMLRNCDIAVLFMSGYSADEGGWRISPSGASRFLQKPFTPRELFGRIRDALDRRGGKGSAEPPR